jgi:DNA-binding LacI/PurR family transcriptional regulator
VNRFIPSGESFNPGATLKTLAERLGVSIATVSNAYNRPEKLSPALRERVLAAAAELGYAGPNPAAAALRRGHAGVVGVVFPESLGYAFRDPGVTAILRGLAGVLERAGLGILLVPTVLGTADPAPVRAAAVDGFVLFSLPGADRTLEAVLARRLPVVAQGGPQRPDAAFVGIDDRAMARAAAEHVLALGHRRVGVVGFRKADEGAGDGAGSVATYRVTTERLAGYRDAAAAAGIELATALSGLNARASGVAAAHALLAAPDPPTAILAMSDELALGVLTAAGDRGLRVPDDLSVVGFDDAGPAEQASLTTVAQDLEAQGARAGELLLGAADWSAEPPHVLLPARLVVRASTGPPPGDAHA